MSGQLILERHFALFGEQSLPAASRTRERGMPQFINLLFFNDFMSFRTLLGKISSESSTKWPNYVEIVSGIDAQTLAGWQIADYASTLGLLSMLS